MTHAEKYPEVAPFVESMYAELEANSHKGDQAGWLSMTLRQAWHEVSWHSAKLAVAIKENDETRMREYAADIANGCMMLVDILDKRSVFDVNACRVCGCTDEDCSGCIERTGQPCWWVESDLCSACESASVVAA